MKTLMAVRALVVLCPALAWPAALHAAAGDPYCGEPGELVSEDASGDAVIVQDPVSDPLEAHDVEAVYFSEPANSDGVDKIRITLKVASLSPEPAPQSVYFVNFTGDDGLPNFVTFRPYVLPGQATHEYGHTEPPSTPGTAGTLVNDGPTDGGSFAADGTITWELAKSKLPALMQSEFLVSIVGEARLIIGSPFRYPIPLPAPGGVRIPSALVTVVDDSPAGAYQQRGNASCAAASGKGALLGGALPLPVLLGLVLLRGARRRG